MPAPDLPADFRLIAAACRWPPGEARDAAVRAAAAEVDDWGAVRRGVDRQRVEGHLHHALASAGVVPPPDTRDHIAVRAAAAARRNLLNAAEEARLQGEFDRAGVRAVFIKGASLAALAYGSQSIKTSRDVDVLVAETDLDLACGRLSEMGYVRRSPSPALDAAGHRAWVSVFRESAWEHPARGLVVEVHTALSRNRRLIPGIGLDSPQRTVELAQGVFVRTLGREPLFAYLTVHGALHVWKRLKWLADVAALVGTEPGEAGRLHEAAVALGAGRCPGLALLLCHEILGLPLEPDLIGRLRGDRATVRLVALCRRFLADNGRDPGFDDRPGALAAIFASKLRLSPGWAYVWAEILDQLRSPPTEAAVHWPVWARVARRLADLPPRWLRGLGRRPAP